MSTKTKKAADPDIDLLTSILERWKEQGNVPPHAIVALESAISAITPKDPAPQ